MSTVVKNKIAFATNAKVRHTNNIILRNWVVFLHNMYLKCVYTSLTPFYTGNYYINCTK